MKEKIEDFEKILKMRKYKDIYDNQFGPFGEYRHKERFIRPDAYNTEHDYLNE